MKRKFFLCLAVLCALGSSSAPLLFAADQFRVRSMTLVSLDIQQPEAKTVELGYNDAIGIQFPKDTTFLKGLEIEVKIPQEVLAFPSCMAYGLYRQVQPSPTEKKIDYQAEQITLMPLPSRRSFVLQVPLEKGHALKSGPYATVVPMVYDSSKGPLLFRLLPIMKGLPENIETLTFSVKVRPLLTEEGGFRLRLAYPREPAGPVSVRIDEALLQATDALQILSPGTHHLSVVSDDYRNEVRMFTVESARITDVTVHLKDITPHLLLVAPENALIFVDGAQVENVREAKPIDPGDHSVLFRIGDYELTKQITIEKGKDYTVSMLIDINVTVSP